MEISVCLPVRTNRGRLNRKHYALNHHGEAKLSQSLPCSHHIVMKRVKQHRNKCGLLSPWRGGSNHRRKKMAWHLLAVALTEIMLPEKLLKIVYRQKQLLYFTKMTVLTAGRVVKCIA